mgnify:CR=1 FL=1
MTRKKIKRYLEYFDKKKDAWIRIQDDNYSEESIKVYDYIMAEIEISCLMEEMNQEINDEGEKN